MRQVSFFIKGADRPFKVEEFDSSIKLVDIGSSLLERMSAQGWRSLKLVISPMKTEHPNELAKRRGETGPMSLDIADTPEVVMYFPQDLTNPNAANATLSRVETYYKKPDPATSQMSYAMGHPMGYQKARQAIPVGTDLKIVLSKDLRGTFA